MKYKNKEWLKHQYSNLKKSSMIIAKECDVSPVTIQKWLKKLNIPIRIDNGYYKKERKKCLNCGKECWRPEYTYCNNKCMVEHHYKKYIKKWIEGEKDGTRSNGKAISNYIKKYLFEISNNKCQKCGWGEKNIYTNKIPLEVHHKDGNAYNTSINNIELLCPSCHSLTSNYKKRGNGRKTRK